MAQRRKPLDHKTSTEHSVVADIPSSLFLPPKEQRKGQVNNPEPDESRGDCQQGAHEKIAFESIAHENFSRHDENGQETVEIADEDAEHFKGH